LSKKQDEVDELKNEVQRVNAVFRQKIEKMSKWQSKENKQEGTDLPEAKRSKKETLRHTDAQCQILN